MNSSLNSHVSEFLYTRPFKNLKGLNTLVSYAREDWAIMPKEEKLGGETLWEKAAYENQDRVENRRIYKVVQIWPGLFVCKQVTVCPGHIWTTLYNL